LRGLSLLVDPAVVVACEVPAANEPLPRLHSGRWTLHVMRGARDCRKEQA